MERISELITKRKLEEESIVIKNKKKDIKLNIKRKDILILKNKHIILIYDKKLEFYKTSLQKYIEYFHFHHKVQY